MSRRCDINDCNSPAVESKEIAEQVEIDGHVMYFTVTAKLSGDDEYCKYHFDAGFELLKAKRKAEAEAKYDNQEPNDLS